MTQYLLNVYQPDGEPPADLDLESIMRDVDALQQEMKAAGVWVFEGRLHLAHTATVLRPSDGEVLTVDGPYAEGNEHIGGFTIIQAEDLDEALEWGRRTALTIGLPIEVRPFM